MTDNDRYVAKWYEPREYPKEFIESKLYKRFIKTQKMLRKRKNEVSGYDPYDECDDAIKAMDHIHKKIQSDCYLVYLLKKENKR